MKKIRNIMVYGVEDFTGTAYKDIDGNFIENNNSDRLLSLHALPLFYFENGRESSTGRHFDVFKFIG